MAKFYSILSVGRGTLGNQYLRRTRTASGKEINVLANKNFNPTNPKTEGQMEQRAKFAVAVKFFKRATKYFFKFAYEDQKANESDYNAFMRHNIKYAIPMIKGHVNNEAYPAIGNEWQLTQGSLVPLNSSWDADGNFNMFTVDKTYSAIGTVGQFSQALIDKGYKAGQIFTLVIVYSTIPLPGYDLISDENSAQYSTIPSWNIGQFIINTEDTTPLAEVGHIGTNYLNALNLPASNGTTTFGVSASSFSSEQAVWGAAIITEKVENSRDLLASTTWLQGNNYVSQILAHITTSTYLAAVLESWGATVDNAILKGSVSNGEYMPWPVVTSAAVTPSEFIIGTTTNVSIKLTGTDFLSERELGADNILMEGKTLDNAILAIYSDTSAELKGDYTPEQSDLGQCDIQFKSPSDGTLDGIGHYNVLSSGSSSGDGGTKA